ncbi:MAG: ATP-binding protein [Azospirillaceae bacterium]|nr:ATP-binding protein [Azospirillaceae bacterium]
MPRIDLFRTASFRIGLFYAGLFSVSVAMLFVVIYLGTTGYTARQITVRVEQEIAALQAKYRVNGRADVVTEITERIAAGSGAYYRLTTKAGQVLAGNLGPTQARSGWVDVHAAETGDHIRAQGVGLPDGSFLIVGVNATRLDELDQRVVQAFLWGTIATLILAVGGAVLMAGVSSRRIEAICSATEEIMAGNLTRRIPIDGSHDEFDRLAAQVNLMLERIESLMRGLQQVSNDIAHDLKTPLTRMRQRLELARYRATSVSAFEDAVDQAIDECDTTLRTFDALLRIAQIEAGTRRSGFQRVDLSALVDTVFTAYQPVAEESGHRLTVALPSGAMIRGDPELIIQMIFNLIENALKHTPAGSRIGLRLDETAGRWCLSIDDDGPGIPAAHRDKVFQRFYRLDPSRSTGGNGLGLSLVAAVAQLHGASIALSDNAPGLRIAITFAADAPVAPPDP